MIKEEAGPERLGQQQSLLSTAPSLIPYIQRWGGVCPPSGVTGDDSLPRGEERGLGSAPNTQGLMKGNLLTLCFLKPYFSVQWWHLLAQDSVKIQSVCGRKRVSPILLESECFITLSCELVQELSWTSGMIQLTAAKPILV